MVNGAKYPREASERGQRMTALAAMLDYIFLESADLELPFVARLVSMARTEVTESAQVELSESEGSEHSAS